MELNSEQELCRTSFGEMKRDNLFNYQVKLNKLSLSTGAINQGTTIQ